MVYLSIVIINYNSEKYIEKCLKSCIKQITNFKYEIIIIDDAITDKSYKKILKYKSKKIRVFRNKKNLGIEKSSNIGLKKSLGKYVCRVDSDDLLEKRFIDTMIKKFEKKYSFYYSNYKVINSQGKIISRKTLPQFNKKEILARGDFLATGTIYKRSILKKQNFYNTKFKNCGLENYELILKLISQKNKGVRINRFLFSLRKHQKNLSKIKKKLIFTYGERIFKKMKLGNYSINKNHPNYI